MTVLPILSRRFTSGTKVTFKGSCIECSVKKKSPKGGRAQVVQIHSRSAISLDTAGIVIITNLLGATYLVDYSVI